jgi:hypothetical protein
MGLLSGLLGHAAEIDAEKLEREFENILVTDEQIEKAYRLIRDLIVFTNKRVVLVDKQGVTGKKTEYQSIPYDSIVRYSKESAGRFDLDAELKIWIRGESEPITKEFKKDKNIHEIYQVLSEYVLK